MGGGKLVNTREFVCFVASLRKALPRYAPDMDDRETLSVWFAELGKLSTDDAGRIYKAAVRSMDSFPSIRQILELAGLAEAPDEDKAREVGERIWSAISRFGHQVSESGQAKVNEYLGPVGVEVVRLQGGWNQICEMATFDNAPTLKAQWRELAAVMLRKGRTGALDAPPEFAKLPDRAKLAIQAANSKLGG
jgi:hypothetical protein